HARHLGGAGDHADARLPDLLGIVLDPARCGKMLRELDLRPPEHLPGVIEDHGARAGGALVESQDGGHGRRESEAPRPASSGPLHTVASYWAKARLDR